VHTVTWVVKNIQTMVLGFWRISRNTAWGETSWGRNIQRANWQRRNIQLPRIVVKSLTPEPATTLVHAFISSCLDYCNALFCDIADSMLQWLQSVQNATSWLVTGSRWSDDSSHVTPILQLLHWLPIRQRGNTTVVLFTGVCTAELLHTRQTTANRPTIIAP